MKTKALFGRKDLDIQIREIELPPLKPDQVLIKVHACGVCGTDLNFVRDWEDEYMPLGHEIAAEVLETGSSVSTLKTGERVIVEDCTMCGMCKACKSGHPEFCRNMYNLNGVPGMSEYMVVNEAALVPFEGIDYKLAALTEPLAVAYNAVLTTEIPLNGSVVILGPGPIGLLCASVARLCGAGFVGITGRRAKNAMSRARLDMASELGCDAVIETDTADIEEVIRSRFPDGVDRVIVTSPPKSMSDAFKIIRYGGTITYLGLSFKPGENIIDFDVNNAIFNKLTLKTSFAEPAINFHASLDLIKSGKVPAEFFQTHTFGFDNFREAFASALNGAEPVIKPVFMPFA